MEYELYFDQGTGSETWCNFSTTTFASTTWRLMFQMGDEFSDWEGLKYEFTAGTAIASGASVTLDQSQISNARVDTSIDTYEFADSTFEGVISRGLVDTATSSDRCAVTVVREILDTELTTADGEITRIETGRVLQGKTWSNAGNSIGFSVTLEEGLRLGS